MLGKKASLGELKRYLKVEKKLDNISHTEFCQGRTMRWSIAWSCVSQPRLPQLSYMIKPKKPATPIFYAIDSRAFHSQQYNLINVISHLRRLLVDELEFEQLEANNENELRLRSFANTWSGQRAKRRKHLQRNDNQEQTYTNRQTSSQDSSLESSDKRSYRLLLKLKQIDSIIQLELNTFEDESASADRGNSDTEFLNQILQYIKNKLSAQEALKSAAFEAQLAFKQD
jgi:hypothetical protein